MTGRVEKKHRCMREKDRQREVERGKKWKSAESESEDRSHFLFRFPTSVASPPRGFSSHPSYSHIYTLYGQPLASLSLLSGPSTQLHARAIPPLMLSASGVSISHSMYFPRPLLSNNFSCTHAHICTRAFRYFHILGRDAFTYQLVCKSSGYAGNSQNFASSLSPSRPRPLFLALLHTTQRDLNRSRINSILKVVIESSIFRSGFLDSFFICSN